MNTSPNLENSAQPVIQIQKMNKWFGQFHVLKEIDLEVVTGERIVICGPSGS
ncbi:MAG: amino acid ABC transporter ATP-binding protein, partial [SAR324 cluster bacterium]|nr:amino acid ABC transporter ATP-binding protein [SAR324 cluster bacterium]